MTYSKTSKKGLQKNTRRGAARRNKAKKGTLENPYKIGMRFNGRTFVVDDDGEIREMDKNGNLIPDHLVKPYVKSNAKKK